jgi:predicted RNA-binding Zn ribbon-like protein
LDQAAGSAQTFDLSGGALCLDFANTLDDRPSPSPRETLSSYAALLAFARQSGALPEGHLARLSDEALRRPAAAEATLLGAVELRETSYRIFLTLADGQPVPAPDLAALNRTLGGALAQARVVQALPGSDHQFAWAWSDESVSLEAPLWPIVRSAADLLTSSRLAALRVCAADACAWLFLDTSRNGSRRWCSMRTCGNRAKARRHHARLRASSGPRTAR